MESGRFWNKRIGLLCKSKDCKIKEGRWTEVKPVTVCAVIHILGLCPHIDILHILFQRLPSAGLLVQHSHLVQEGREEESVTLMASGSITESSSLGQTLLPADLELVNLLCGDIFVSSSHTIPHQIPPNRFLLRTRPLSEHQVHMQWPLLELPGETEDNQIICPYKQ